MKIKLLLILTAAAMVASVACAAAPHSMAMPMAKPAPATAEVVRADVHADAAWVRAAPPGAMMLVGYMTLHNNGKTPVRFSSAKSDDFGMVELHRTQIVNGVSTMRPAGEQAIAPGATLRIVPGGFHLMLMQPKRALKVGDSVHFRLTFADGSVADVEAKVSAQAPTAATR